MNYVEEIIENPNAGSAEDKFYAIADIIADKEAEGTFNSLKMEEKNIYMIDVLLSEIDNGGLDAYFFNTGGKYVDDTINLLKMLNQHEMAEILKRAAEIYFGDTDEEDKYDLLNEFDEKIYSQIDKESIYKACLEYLRAYSKKFN